MLEAHKKFLLFVRKKAPLKDFWYLLHHFTWHQRLASLGLLYCFPDLSLEAAAVYQCVWKLQKKSLILIVIWRQPLSPWFLAGKFKYIANRHFLHLHFTLHISHLNVWFWHFPPIFVLLKLACLVTLFDRKLQVFKNSPKWTILAFLINFCPLKM